MKLIHSFSYLAEILCPIQQDLKAILFYTINLAWTRITGVQSRETPLKLELYVVWKTLWAISRSKYIMLPVTNSYET